ncbi:MAG: alpha/beta fold hydrolase [Sneathiellales bacterium]|nr:alpha/beta fold hydrolase [Sneathiellales bacterium]
MAQVKAGSLSLEVETFGKAENPAVILIAGLGFQLIDWPVSFCKTLADAGYHVVRFDNRDVGKSERLENLGLPDMEKVIAARSGGEIPDVPYGLHQMAEDVVHLMDSLSLARAHIAGMSMGGMITQLMAIHHSARCLSMTSIMSSSGEASVSAPDPEAMAAISGAPASPAREDIIAFGLGVNDVIGSPGFRWDRDALKAHIGHCVDRGVSPNGYMRQMAAVFTAPSRREELKKVSIPALVIHGTEDRLVPISAGQDTADHIPGATMVPVDGMGHDLSPDLCVRLAEIILPHLNRHSSI